MKSGRKIENRFLPDFFILNDVMKAEFNLQMQQNSD